MSNLFGGFDPSDEDARPGGDVLALVTEAQN